MYPGRAPAPTALCSRSGQGRTGCLSATLSCSPFSGTGVPASLRTMLLQPHGVDAAVQQPAVRVGQGGEKRHCSDMAMSAADGLSAAHMACDSCSRCRPMLDHLPPLQIAWSVLLST